MREPEAWDEREVETPTPLLGIYELIINRLVLGSSTRSKLLFFMNIKFFKQSHNDNFFTKLFKYSIFCMLLLISSCSLVLTSCGDDNDDNEEVVSVNSIAGTWQSTHVIIWNKIGGQYTEDGPYEGNDGVTCKSVWIKQKFLLV